jgi:predicted O-methyltransferase YrrM
VIESLAVSGSERSILEVITSIVVVAIIVIGYFLWSFVKGAGYEPVPGRILDEMIEFSAPGPGKQVYDLGSGFGKIIIKVAQRTGAACTGVEVDPLKVWWTRRQIRAKGLEKQVKVVKQDLLDADISSADIVFVFLWDGIMQKLKSKVLREMKPGTLVVSYYHQFRGWVPEKEDVKAKVYLYRIPTEGSQPL